MRALIWGAVSSKRQAAIDKVSIERQLELGRQHAAKWNMTVVGELVVPGETRSIALYDRAARAVKGYYVDEQGNRHECFVYAKLLELVEAEPRPFDVLIFLDRSRLGRKASLSMTVIEICEEVGIKPYDIESPPSTMALGKNYEERLIGAFRSVGAQREVEQLTERTQSGISKRVQDGFFSNRVPWGYVAQYEKRTVVGYTVDQAIIDTVLLIYDLYEEGQGTDKIAEHLTAQGIPSPSGQDFWYSGAVREIIGKAMTYAGFVEWHSKDGYICVRGKHPAVISEARAKAILAERSERRAARRSVGSVYRYSRMCRCAICGGKICVRAGNDFKRGKNYTFERYVCRHHGGATLKTITAWLEKFVEKLQEDAFFHEIVGVQNADQRPIIEKEIAAHQDAIAVIEKKLLIAEDALLSGDMSKERYRLRKAEFDAQIADRQKTIAALQTALNAIPDATKRTERAQEIRDHGLAMLTTPDVRTANAWWRKRLRILVAHKRVFAIIDKFGIH